MFVGTIHRVCIYSPSRVHTHTLCNTIYVYRYTYRIYTNMYIFFFHSVRLFCTVGAEDLSAKSDTPAAIFIGRSLECRGGCESARCLGFTWTETAVAAVVVRPTVCSGTVYATVAGYI